MSQNEYFQQRLQARRDAGWDTTTHKQTYFRSGANDAYWNASCSCGWQSKAWTHYKRDVVREFHAHVAHVKS